MTSAVPEPTPDPVVADSWFQRPAFLATSALVVLLVGAGLWFLGRERDRDAAPALTSPASATIVTATDATAVVATTVETEVSTLGPTTPTTVVNVYGDVVGQPATAATPVAAYASAIQANGDPASVAVLHTPAYYYALWTQLTGRGAGGQPVATPDGYAVATRHGTVELTAFQPVDGLIRDGTEVRDGVAIDFAAGIQITGLCQPDREPQCDLSGPNFAPDVGGSPAQMWALAKAVLAPDTDTWILYVDLHGARIVSASVDGSTSVGFDAALNIVAVTYPKNPPPGTVLTLMTSADDGTTAQFDFAVS